MEKFFHVYYYENVYESNKYLYGEDYPLTPNFELICMDFNDNICIDLQKLFMLVTCSCQKQKAKDNISSKIESLYYFCFSKLPNYLFL